VLSLTPRAAQAVLTRAEEAGVAGWLLRVAVVAGGCNGLTYELYFVEAAGPDDVVIDLGEVRVALDRKSAALLEGTVVDLPSGPGFRFKNPRARRTCSCGASFET
jgi:iron-sulfur cluster assembly protein